MYLLCSWEWILFSIFFYIVQIIYSEPYYFYNKKAINNIYINGYWRGLLSPLYPNSQAGHINPDNTDQNTQAVKHVSLEGWAANKSSTQSCKVKPSGLYEIVFLQPISELRDS